MNIFTFRVISPPALLLAFWLPLSLWGADESPEKLKDELAQLTTQLSDNTLTAPQAQRMLAVCEQLIAANLDQLPADSFTAKSTDASTAPDKQVKADDLSSAARKLLEQQQVDILDWMEAACRIMLQWQVPQDIPYVEYPAGRVLPRHTERLADILHRCESHLKVALPLIQELRRYLEWYSADDWYQRYGATGFYDCVVQLQRRIILADAMWCYYSCAWQTCTSGADLSADSPSDSQSIVEPLQASLHRLEDITESLDAEGSSGLIYRLWRIRLATRLAHYVLLSGDTREKYRDYAQRQTQLLRRTPLSADTEYELRFEALRRGDKNQPDIAELRRSLQSQKDWLISHKEQLTNYPEKLLHLTLLEYHLGFRADISLKEFFPSLRDLAGQFPQLRQPVQTLIAEYAAAEFTAGHPDTFTRAWDDSTILNLADYYQTTSPADYELAAAVYDSFLAGRDAGNEHFPLVLYEAGLCHYQLSRQSQDPNTIARQTVSAIDCWLRLADDFSAWSAVDDPRHISAAAAAALSAQLAYHLFLADELKYGDLARRSLTCLVGRIADDSAEPVGPYAETPAARQYRYYLAAVLLQQGQFDQAARLFAAVPDDDSHKSDARFYAIICQLRQAERDNPPLHAIKEHYQQLGDELGKIIADDSAHPLAVKAVSLLVQKYQQLLLPAPALKLIADTMSSRLRDEQLSVLGLQLLQQQRDNLLLLHAQSRQSELLSLLDAAEPLARKIYESFSQPPEDRQLSLAWRTYLEVLTLAAIAHLDHSDVLMEKLRRAERLLNQVALVEQSANNLWLVRCRALLAFARRDYSASRSLWYAIRGSAGASDPASRYYWWESRYFGLRCLLEQGDSQSVAHTIDVLLKSRPEGPGPWENRLVALRQLAQDPPSRENLADTAKISAPH